MSTTVPDDCGCPDFAVSRRRLLAGAAVGAGTLTGLSMFGDAARQVAYGASRGGNVVVVLSLRGGADGLSIVVPKGDQELLRRMRPQLFVGDDRFSFGDDRFGLHPALAPLKGMWDAGRFGAVHGVGLPVANRSHFEAMNEMEDADPGSVQRVGWINRMISSDALAEQHLQLGRSLLPLQLYGANPSLAVTGLDRLTLPTVAGADRKLHRALRKTWRAKGPMRKGARQAIRITRRLTDVAATDLASAQEKYPVGDLRWVLANTAALIKADVGARVVTIDYGAWDMHQGLGSPQPGNLMYDQLAHLAQSLSTFFEDLGAHANRTTVMTLTEFGRRVAENGSGTDHGYASATLLLGAGVRGGQVTGPWAGLDRLEQGDVPLQTDYRSVAWEVMKNRFPEIRRRKVFPNFNPEFVGCMR
ncbi:MAG: DUF1501 domain-containing protein [Nocardioides sp.]